jgi:sugar (pentulose or hexulose) kinase
MTATEGQHDPDPAAHARYSELFEAYRGIYPALSDTFAAIARRDPD